ncbi:MAG: HAMP domain-containing histidine kinase [Deltaproteobacteria bacterium]|nr:HAMP domain-containing histidine kinase [Deltaproteobacteria bacterium]
MRKVFPISLKSRLLIVLVMASGLPLLLFIISIFIITNNQIKERVRDQLSYNVSLVSSLLEDQMQYLQSVSRDVEKDETLDSVLVLGLNSKLQDYLLQVRKIYGLSFATVTDENGQAPDPQSTFLLFNQKIKHPLIHRAVLGLPSASYALVSIIDLERLDPSLRNVFLQDKGDHQVLVMMVVKPLTYENERMTAIFVGGKILELDTNLMQKIKRIAGVEVALVSQGRMVAGSVMEPFGPLPYLAPFPSPDIDGVVQIGGERCYINELALKDHQNNPVAYAAVLLSGLPFNQLRQSFYVSGLVFLLVGGLVSIFISALLARSIVSPIHRLGWQTYIISEGVLDQEIPVTRDDEIGALTRDFNTMIRKLSRRTQDLQAAQEKLIKSERLAALGQLTATVSHEIRNPLGTVRNSLFTIDEVIRGQGLLRAERALDRAERSIVRCDRIIEELLDYTRIKSLELKLTSLEDWLGHFLDEYQIPKEIELVRILLPRLQVSIDRERFRRCLINVIDNALQAMTAMQTPAEMAGQGEKAAKLTIETRQISDQIEILVTDTGPGITADQLEKIFEPLYSTKSFGVGLGLPIVRQIMDQHGGGVDIETEPGQGTVFILWLPLPEKGNRQGELQHA